MRKRFISTTNIFCQMISFLWILIALEVTMLRLVFHGVPVSISFIRDQRQNYRVTILLFASWFRIQMREGKKRNLIAEGCSVSQRFQARWVDWYLLVSNLAKEAQRVDERIELMIFAIIIIKMPQPSQAVFFTVQNFDPRCSTWLSNWRTRTSLRDNSN